MISGWKKKRSFLITLALAVGICATASTMAVLMTTTGAVTNTFLPGDVKTVIEETIDDQPVAADTAVLKQPAVKNTGPSNAFVRARITISPSDAGVTLLAGSWDKSEGIEKQFREERMVYDGTAFSDNGDWLYRDGYYYYMLPIEPEQSTETLFDAVKLHENADITIYQEAVFSEQYAPGRRLANEDVTKIIALFDAIEK